MPSSLSFVVMVLGLVAVSLRNVDCTISDEDKLKIHTAILPFVLECGKEYGVTEDEIKAAKAAGQIGDIDPCLIACVFRKIKLIDEKGLFDFSGAEALVKKYISTEDDQKKVIEIIETCKSVNDEAVSDGEKGCERAKLLFECTLPFKDQLVSRR